MTGEGSNPGFYFDNASGYARIHTLAAGREFQVIGGVGGRANAWNVFSDRRLKENFEPIADPFALLAPIKGLHYSLKADGRKAFGVVAQDVELTMPDAVRDDQNGIKAVDYNQIAAPLENRPRSIIRVPKP